MRMRVHSATVGVHRNLAANRGRSEPAVASCTAPRTGALRRFGGRTVSMQPAVVTPSLPRHRTDTRVDYIYPPAARTRAGLRCRVQSPGV